MDVGRGEKLGDKQIDWKFLWGRSKRGRNRPGLTDDRRRPASFG